MAILVVIAIVSLVLGFLAYRNYESLDFKWFGNGNPEYRSSGKWVLLVSAVIGSFEGFFIAIGVANGEPLDYFPTAILVWQYIIAGLLVTIVLCAGFYQLTRSESLDNAVGKTFFMFGCSVIAFIAGVAASIITLMIVLIIIGIRLFSAVTSSAIDSIGKSSSTAGKNQEPREVWLSDGSRMVQTGPHGHYENSQTGKTYWRSGSDFIPRD